MEKTFMETVGDRARHTPWASVDLKAFARAMAQRGAETDVANAISRGEEPPHISPGKNDFFMKVEVRPGTESGYWWTVKWTGADGLRHQAAGQWLDRVLWKAAQREIDAEEEAKNAEPV